MKVDITKAIYDKLAGTAAVTSLLPTYGGSSPAQHTIFTAMPIPGDAPRPYVATPGDVSVVPWDNLSETLGLDIQRDVYCIADNTGSADEVEELARQVFRALHRQWLTISGGVPVMRCYCVAGPVIAPTDDRLLGRLLTFRIVAKET